MKRITMIGLIALTLVFAGCGTQTEHTQSQAVTETPKPTVTEAVTPTQAATPTPLPPAEISLTQTIMSGDSSYSFMVPATWTDMKGQINEEMDIETGSNDDEIFFTTLSEMKDGSEIMDLDMYNQVLTEHLQANIADAQTGEKQSITVGSYPGYRTKITGSTGGVKIVYWLYTLDTSTYYVQINAWTKAELDTMEPMLDNIVQSFQSY